LHSIAVPIVRGDGKVSGSVLMLGAASKTEMSEALDLVPMLQAKAADITELLPHSEPGGDPE
jgi:DNA-binding IclR family transcriptional regulator